jgi:hypothetical protein
MAIDPAPWTLKFTRHSRLPWTCPACGGGRLQLREDTLHVGQTSESIENQKHPASDPEWVKGRFSCMLSCPHCSGQIAMSGEYGVQDDRHYDDFGEAGDYENYYRPLFFSDAPHIISIPAGAPELVSEQVRKSFQLYWSDMEACANSIRIAVEKLLTSQGIPRTSGRPAARSGKKRSYLTLHSRIELFRAKNEGVADALMAVKWIGNAGSHSAPTRSSDLLDGYALMSFALDELYLKRDARIGALTRTINRRRAPRSRRRSS